jgi:hypothetical protein
MIFCDLAEEARNFARAFRPRTRMKQNSDRASRSPCLRERATSLYRRWSVSANTRSSTGDDDCERLVVVLGEEEEEEEEEESSDAVAGAGAVEQEGSKPSCCAHLGCLNSNMMFAPRMPASEQIQAEEEAPHSSTIHRDESSASSGNLSARKNSSARCKTTEDATPERQAKQHTAMFDCCCCARGGMLAPNPNPSAAEEPRIAVW